jgi:hypothetical protein
MQRRKRISKFPAYSDLFHRKKLGFLKKIIPAFSSDRAYASLRVPETRSICAFSEDSKSLIVVSAEGNYYDAPIPKQPGQINDFEAKPLQ